MKKSNIIAICIVSISCLIAATPVVVLNSSADSTEASQPLQKQCVISFETNGGSKLSNMLYVLGDNLKLPEPKKDGYTFAGWYFDDMFQHPFISKDDIESSLTLYAKWVIKPIKIYFDTYYKDEFEPLIMEYGETLKYSMLPTPKRKNEGRLQYPFKCWKDTNENTFEKGHQIIIKDHYYAFHATYGSPDMDDKYEIYKNDFSNNCGYIDPDFSWSRVMDWTTYDYASYDGKTIPTHVNANIAAYREIKVVDGTLVMESTQSGYHFVDNGLYLPEVCYQNSNSYSVEVELKITKYISTQDAKSAAFDSGFGIATRINDNSKAYVATMYDPNAKVLRVGALNANNEPSDTSINNHCFYNLPLGTNVNAYHKIKVVVSGENENTTMKAYFDGTLAFTYSDISANTEWFKKCATGNKIAIFANSCDVAIKSVSVMNDTENVTLYSTNFVIPTTKFADGWMQDTNSIGSNNGEYNISNGKLNIKDAYKMTQYHHQIIYAPSNVVLKDGIISFELTFNKLAGEEYNDPSNSNDSKYLSLCLRCGDPNTFDYGCVTFRQSGNILTYHHTTSSFSSWGSGLHTYRGKSDTNKMNLNQTYLITVVLDGDMVSVFVDETLIGEFDHSSSNMFTYEQGRIGLLCSSINLSIDNFRVCKLLEVQE